MPFGVKNGLLTYHRVVTKMFCEYIFVDNFTIFNDLLIHLEKLIKCFFKCGEFGISLNPDKCAFVVFSEIIIGFIMPKRAKSWILIILRL